MIDESEKRSDFPAGSEKHTFIDEERSHDERVEYPVHDDEGFEFTWRSSIVGSLLGCIVAASNFYLGLKVGWTFGASIFAAAFTFGILKPLSNALPVAFGGRYFGPRENVTAQTAASTSGGLSVGMITAIPAMYRLGLLSDDVTKDTLRLTLWTIAASMYGLCFAVPLRKYFIIKLRDKIPFPTPTATAQTIRILHSSTTGAKNAMDSVKAMAAAFSKLASSHLVIYIFDKIHITYWIGRATGSAFLQRADVTWGFYFTPNFAFFGAGFITPPNVVFSFLAGSIIAFGIGGPIMLDHGYLTFALGWGRPGNGSAQSWWFWPGISLMIVTAFADLFSNWSVMWVSLKSAWNEVTQSVVRVRGRLGDKMVEAEEMDKKDARVEVDDGDDGLPGVPFAWWGSGLLVSLISTCFIMGFQFGIPAYQSILAVIFAFFLSIVGIFAAGQTDINPISTLAKVVQLVFARMPASSLQDLQRSNLLCAAVTSSSANQSVDMIGDLKTGHLIGASPRSQFLAQLVGSFFAVIMNVSLFTLFAKAYPCITNVMDTCEFGLSPILSWQNVTVLLTQNPFIPLSSVATAIVCAVLAVIYVFVTSNYIPDEYYPYLPNLNAVGLGFIVPQPSTPLAMAFAVIVKLLWQRYHKSSSDNLCTAVAAGALAGVGITGMH
ncbi:OPT superfamily oligopeptide transporter [Gonapodya prolifera JEL478]|uniref:OPT superfamily oligopeptide transporter n=1 Tax=Gonapodya prolifera (strain JEL478) TaxID=1344416 RepID=A0A139ANG9_GONPJ|nr:OPT superfamily oligopeptide transporter [Gonapodya prolifera JEL478]|eukprot:KXS18282.1 OPT superfamily oligopeptide transporter [Gonapodya prolifera JEL478]